MNIIFITLLDFTSLNERGIYTDLLNEFAKYGHHLYIISPSERKNKLETHLIKENSNQILKLQIGNIQKTGFIEKGISTVLLEPQMKKAIKQYFSEVKFDLIICTTPPITFNQVVRYIKKRDHAKFYLLLKDIFPQNAVDMDLFGHNSPIYKFFRKKEKELYQIADYIGCMSPANVSYVLEHNTSIKKECVEVCPNSITPLKMEQQVNKLAIRQKYNLPLDKRIFIYGGNLGKPQCVDFIIECLKQNENLADRYFVICGKGTDYGKLEQYMITNKPDHLTLINGLPKKEYDELVKACDIGLLFLDHRFTIPNYPSRLLSYMENSMPVLACVDKNTDVGPMIENNHFGYWCESNDSKRFKLLADKFVSNEISIITMGENSYQCLLENYTSDKSYHIIMKHFET